ncbi:MAG: 50S ribosomal protein L1 [Candidatus Thermoplasmatota archaeon]|nr:50S ribosomal protein L1 [Candidatus Thermoplasmatota archaeon]
MAEQVLVKGIEQALERAKPRNFNESVEVAINLRDIDLSVPSNRIEEEVVLPRGRGRDVKVAVFASGEMAVKARDAADLIIAPEDIETLADDKARAKDLAQTHDFFVAEAPLMPAIGRRLGTVLGPRGKMPRPLPPGSDPVRVIRNLKRAVRLRSKDRPTFHAALGTRNMEPKDLAENLEAILKRVAAQLPRGRTNIGSVYVKTTMGPAVRVV